MSDLPLYTIFLICPLTLALPLADPSLFQWLLAALSITILTVAEEFEASNRSRGRSSVLELMPLVILVGVFAYHFARLGVSYEGTREMSVLVLGAAAYLYMRSLSEQKIQLGLNLFAASACVLSVYAILQVLGVDLFSYPSESWSYRAVTTFGHRNFTAMFLLTGFFCVMSSDWWATASRRFAGCVALTTIFAGLLATGSRVPIVIAMITVAFSISKLRKTHRLAVIAPLILVAVWVGILIVRSEGRSILLRTETIDLRRELYAATAPLVGQNPVLGGGSGSFSRGIAESLTARTSDAESHLIFLHAHMLPAEIVIDYGVVGLFSLGLFLFPIVRAVARSKSWRFDPIVWAVASWLLINLYDVNSFQFAGWVCFWPLAAAVRSRAEFSIQAEAGFPERSTAPLRTLAAIIPLALVVIALSILSLASFHSGAGQIAMDRGDCVSATAEYEQAATVIPLPLEGQYRYGVALLQCGRAQEGLDVLRSVEEEAPAFSAVRYNLAVAWLQLGDANAARGCLGGHLKAYPNDADAIGLLRGGTTSDRSLD